MSRWTKRPVLLVSLLCLVGLLVGAYLLVGPGDPDLRAVQTAIEKRDFASALRLLNGRLERYPDDLSARIQAAEVARRNGDYDQARQHLRVFELSEGPPLALELEQRLLAVQMGDPAEAALIHGFCRDHPDSPEAPLALEALIVGDLGKLARPLESPDPFPIDSRPEELKRLLVTADVWLKQRQGLADQLQGLVWRARARRLAGDHPGAIADVQRALELDPDHFDARAYLALFIAQEQPLESIAHFEMLRKRNPSDVRLTYAIATARRSVGHLDEAREALDEILGRQPRNKQVLLERGRLALDQRELAAAKGFLDRAAAAGEDSAQFHLVMARYMTLTGNTEGAKQHQERFLKLDAQRSQPSDK